MLKDAETRRGNLKTIMQPLWEVVVMDLITTKKDVHTSNFYSVK